MSLSYLHRLALTAIVLGCLIPVFALTSVTLTDGSVARGTIVSESSDFVVLNVDGVDRTISRSTIQNIRRDEDPAAAPADAVAPGYSSAADELSPSATPVDARPAEETYGSAPSRLGRQTREHASIGIDVFWSRVSRYSTEYQNNTSESRTTNNLMLKPYVGIRKSDFFELRPALMLARLSSSTEYTVDEGLYYSPTSGSLKSVDSSSTRLGFDFGFIFYPIHGNFFRFFIGPSIGYDFGFAPHSERTFFGTTPSIENEYDSYVDMNIPIRFPIGFDFVASKNLGFRLSSEVYRFNININYLQVGTSSSSYEYSVVTVGSSLDLSKVLTDFGIGMFLLF